MSLGLKQAGFDVLAAVDIDPLAVETYQANHAGVHVWQTDIRTLDAQQMMADLGLRVGELDLLAGCPPCQGFSSIRTRNRSSVADDRNDLIFDFLRFVEAFRPRAAMLENVPGLAADRRMASVVSTLESFSYTVSAAVLDAANYGVPQRRRRLILLAGLHGKIPFGRRSRQHRCVLDAIGHLPAPARSRDPLHGIPERRSAAVVALIERIPPDGGSRTDVGLAFQLKCHQRIEGFYDVYGRMAWQDVAPTITGGCVNPSKGRFLHPEQHRSITPREAALLQSFPPRYTFTMSQGKYRVAELIGNALPPEFIRRHAASIIRYLSRCGCDLSSPARTAMAGTPDDD
jgi:DNA (cytosine-5)-methyltransferase 1